jgi:hypothetical protein
MPPTHTCNASIVRIPLLRRGGDYAPVATNYTLSIVGTYLSWMGTVKDRPSSACRDQPSSAEIFKSPKNLHHLRRHGLEFPLAPARLCSFRILVADIQHDLAQHGSETSNRSALSLGHTHQLELALPGRPFRRVWQWAAMRSCSSCSSSYSCKS